MWDDFWSADADNNGAVSGEEALGALEAAMHEDPGLREQLVNDAWDIIEWDQDAWASWDDNLESWTEEDWAA